MLDVHPPEHAAHTWRDFFIHIATICVGLLIAIGLEQSVEAIHTAHERNELRAALQRENQQILHDAHAVDVSEGPELRWLQGVETQVANAAHNHQPVGALPADHPLPWDVPDNPIFTAAKSSGRLALLRDDELVAYGEMDGVLKRVDDAYTHLSDARRGIDSFTRSVNFDEPGSDPLAAQLTLEQLRVFHTRLVQMESATKDFRYWSRQAEGAATVIQRQDFNLTQIEHAERMFDKNP
ncbi:MAG: hypothetical protein WBY53_04435 [Acidobacteriaceae bacterium]